jgi:FAD/FMN-containing dehydrogenase
MKISCWGRYSVVEAKVLQPVEINDIKTLIKDDKKIITRGLGRSYGDCVNNEIIVDSSRLNNFIKFDLEDGIIVYEARISIREVSKITILWEWYWLTRFQRAFSKNLSFKIIT